MERAPLHLGIDVGTSGVRGAAIDAEGHLVASAAVPMEGPERQGVESTQNAEVWWSATRAALAALLERCDAARVRSLAVDGTSGTALAIDRNGTPCGPGWMYDDARAGVEATAIARLAPRTSGAHGATSGLAKTLRLLSAPFRTSIAWVVSQADWIAGQLLGRHGTSDENNALKFGYDPIARAWPSWLRELGVAPGLLPRVVPPGTPLGPIAPTVARTLGLPAEAVVVSGTTDSIAAFLAAGAGREGDAVTSLGSTLVLKVVATSPVAAPELGVYSHRLGDLWLAGGASNTGGAVLRELFGDAELAALEPALRPDEPTGLDYYPLSRPGERFPVCDPSLAPRLAPRPAERARFLQGVLEGIARIEAEGYRVLAGLGAPFPTSVRTAGGGARNAAFARIRARVLGVPLVAATSGEAALGAAELARRGAS